MRLRPIAVLATAVLLLTACGDDSDDPAPPPAAAPVASAEVSAPPAGAPDAESQTGTGTGKPEIVTNPDGTINSGGPRPATSESALTAGGFGPYKIGVTQKALASSGLVGKVASIKSGNCTGYGTGKGIGKYDSPALVFFKGRLLRLTVTSKDVATDKGVKLGTTMKDVQAKYPAGKQIDDWTGRGAWLATVGDFGLLFAMRDGKVSEIEAGMAEPMQFRYTDNQGC